MAADLIVRTERAEYTSGDIVYGAVYLKISGPTCALGVQLKFYGYETFNYLPKRNSLNADWIQDTKEYVASDQLTLYEFDNPIALGNYVFPFQKRLPMDLPGSTSLKSLDNANTEWKVEIVYGVEASLLGANEIRVRQNFVVSQPSLQTLYMKPEILEGIVEMKKFSLKTWMPLVSTETNVTVCVSSDQHYTGDNLKLKLDIEMNGVIKPKIESIVFQLLRDLRITFTRPPPSKDTKFLESTLSRTLKGMMSLGFDQPRLSEGSIPEDDPLSAEFVNPEGSSYVVQHSRLVDVEGMKLINGIEELLIPLKDIQGKDLPATTLGNNIWLMYSLKITIKFQNNDPVIVHIPICCILPRFLEWSQWKPGDWVYDCKVMTSGKSPCCVSQEVIESVKFSSLPSFQVV